MACALLYNFKDAARLQKVRFALFKLGVSGRVVAPEELSQPIGYLCDLEGFSPVEETVEGRACGIIIGLRIEALFKYQ